MEDKNDDILAQIQELRAQADKDLHGNDYFAIAQKLDALIVSGDLASVREELQSIRAGFSPDAAVCKTSALQEPAAQSNNELLDNIAKLREEAKEKLQGNDYFNIAQKLDALLALNDPGSAATEEALAHIRSLLDNGQKEAGLSPEPNTGPEQQAEQKEAEKQEEAKPEPTIAFFPKANSFGTPQPTVAVRLVPVESEPAPVPAAEASPDANAAAPEAVQADPAPAVAPAEVETSPSTWQQASETDEKNGFDALTEASWRRVREVTASDAIAKEALNGAATDDDAFFHAAGQGVDAAGTDAPTPRIELSEAPSFMDNAPISKTADLVNIFVSQIAENASEEIADITSATSEQATDAAQAAISSVSEAAENASEKIADVASATSEQATDAAQAMISSVSEAAIMDEPAAETQIETSAGADAELPGEPEAALSGNIFRVTPPPVIINRPVKGRFVRPKRLAKLPYLPKHRG
ncbi:MAG: hypothetical protein KTR19_03800 [Hyphomicrobiales bacterium]|nr:hypothetical protein [Hyphomicrobiales bacterium]